MIDDYSAAREIDRLRTALYAAATALQTYRRDTGTPDVYAALDIIAAALGYDSREELPRE